MLKVPENFKRILIEMDDGTYIEAGPGELTVAHSEWEHTWDLTAPPEKRYEKSLVCRLEFHCGGFRFGFIYNGVLHTGEMGIFPRNTIYIKENPKPDV